LCTVPEVIEMTVAAATSAIEEACAAAVTVTTKSDDSEAGAVLGTSPPAGSKIAVGSAVRVFVAKADEVTVPNVIGKSRSGAKATLEAAKLAFASAPSSNDQTQAIGQQPAAGEHVPRGSSVNVTFEDPTLE
jgi:serine/threonine-protein kinase